MSTQCLCCDTRDAGHRYACDRCVNDMRRWLTELEDYAVVIAVTMAPLAAGITEGSVGRAFGSRAPADDAKATLLDYRSGAGAAVYRLRDPRDMDDDPVRSLPGSVHGIACWLRSERDESEPVRWTLASELRYLRTAVDWCAQQQWVDELHADLKELHGQARMLAKDTPPGPLGHCLTVGCEGVVFPATIKDSDGRHDGGRCSACSRPYTGPDLVRLGVSEEMAG